MAEIVTPTPQEEAVSGGGGYTLIIGFIIFVLIGIVIFGIIFYIIYKIVTLIKQRTDIFYRIRIERIKLAVTHRTYKAKFRLFRYWKNPPIRLLRYDFSRKIFSLTEPVAYYRGHYSCPEGNVIMAVYIPGNFNFLIVPRTELLIINDRSIRRFKIGDKVYEKKLPVANDILQFNDNDIYLKCDSIADSGMFYVPVVRNEKGEIIDLTPATMDSMNEVAINKLYYEIMDTWQKTNKKAVDVNPYVRIINKTGKESTSIEQREEPLR